MDASEKINVKHGAGMIWLIHVVWKPHQNPKLLLQTASTNIQLAVDTLGETYFQAGGKGNGVWNSAK